MTQELLQSYDEFPYESNPFHLTHPDTLATVATLFGLAPAPVDHCRVLELGCAGGGNLIPMALALPHSSFVGIDLSPRQVEAGQQDIRELGLSNIELRPLSILDVGPDLGRFDYVICHGVYSWVPPEVQDRTLAVCRHNLAPHGVAYVSYNTYPGWHVRGMIREMLRYHVRRYHEPGERVRQARAFLDFLTESVHEQQGVYRHLLKEEARLLAGQPDSYVLHEQLESVNAPLYFHQFVERAAGHGLQYLGEALFSDMALAAPSPIRQRLQGFAGDPIQLEQYRDFLRDRTFRRSLLCHQDLTLRRTPDPAVVPRCHLTALAVPLDHEADVRTADVEKFQSQEGATLSTNNPCIKAALHALFDAWPRALSFDTLRDEVDDRRGPGSADRLEADRQLAEPLLQCYAAGLVELHVHAQPVMTDVSARPVASPLARLQARRGHLVTNLRHRSVELQEFDRQVLTRLDGSRDGAELARDLDGVAAEDGGPLDEQVARSLTRFAGASLLVG